MAEPARVHNPLFWVPSSYAAEGIPFAIVNMVAATMLKDLGHKDAEITLATASIGIVWSLKPFWASFLDMFKTKKFFILAMELLMAAALALVSATLPLPNYFQILIALLWVIGFASATQDICVDGVYVTSLKPDQQAAWIGVQGMSWNLGKIFAAAIVAYMAGRLHTGFAFSKTAAWGVSFALLAGMMAAFAAYHYVFLPTGQVTKRPSSAGEILGTFVETLGDFFRKPAIWGMLLFVFLYRSGEGFLLVQGQNFIQAEPRLGGAGFIVENKSIVELISSGFSIAAGLLAGLVISKLTLRKALFPLALAMNIPHLCFVLLSQMATPTAPLDFNLVLTLVTIEKFGYSFGFAANMLYMMQQIAPGKYQTTHYAYCTSIMNLVLIPTQMASGPLSDWMGYKTFFLFVMVASIPSVLAAWFAPFPNGDGGDVPKPVGGH